MYRFGWWSTGRDRDALNLFNAVYDACQKGVIPGTFSYCFISRDRGESSESDTLINRVEECGIPVVTLSASNFEPELRARDREQWRNRYHHQVLESISGFQAEAVVLAGYMWVVSPEVCEAFPIINLHPAEPHGPAGTWQEVIWQLLEKRAERTGVMMHLVTPELDKGPPVSFCTFAISGPQWDTLWEEFEKELSELGSIEAVKEKFGEKQSLFAAIRREGVKRELPLIVQTIQGPKIVVTESDLNDYPGMWIRGAQGTTITITHPGYPKVTEQVGDREVYVRKILLVVEVGFMTRALIYVK